MTGQDHARRPGRPEIVSTAVVLVLVAIGVFALWPRGGASDVPDAARAPAPVAEVDAGSNAELAPLRTAAGLAGCPEPVADTAAETPLALPTLPCLGEAEEVDLGAVRGPVLLNLWASWCGPCRAELPALAEYAARPGATPVLLVDVDDDPRAALRLLRELGVTLPSVFDTGTAVRTALDVPPGLPYSYLLRADGSVAPVDPPIPFGTADDVAAAVTRLAR